MESVHIVTGDVGHFEGDLLFCEGRIDFQIKLHGHRIELEDIDNNLLKNPKIRQGCNGSFGGGWKVKSITSFVVYNEPIEKRFETVKLVKKNWRNMCRNIWFQRKSVFLDEMPLNNNGKIDKKQLKSLCSRCIILKVLFFMTAGTLLIVAFILNVFQNLRIIYHYYSH